MIGRLRQFVVAGLLCGAALTAAQPGFAQASPPMVDSDTAARLVWATMVGLDQANSTGNYSVLRDLAAPGFQANNSPATLAVTFQALRAQQVDLTNCLLIAPTYQFPPTIVQNGLLRLRGGFPLRPVGVAFDLLFMNINGQWRLFGLAVVPVTPAPPPQPPARGAQR